MKTDALVYDYLLKTIQQNGYPPTLQEIRTACDLDETPLMQAINHLEREGRIRRSAHKSRAIRLTELDWHWYSEDQITQFIQTYSQEHRGLPTVFEIAKACGLSTAVVMDYLAHQQSEVKDQHLNDVSLLATA